VEMAAPLERRSSCATAAVPKTHARRHDIPLARGFRKSVALLAKTSDGALDSGGVLLIPHDYPLSAHNCPLPPIGEYLFDDTP
jgi:hypothetical protein